MSISIPDDLWPGIKLVASIPYDSFRSSLEQVERYASGSRRDRQPLGEPAGTIASVVQNLEIGRDALGLSLDTFVSELIDTAKTAEFEFGDLSVEQFSSRITELLSVPAIKFKSKAASLWLEAQRFATGCRIVTDIRPLFSDEIENNDPSGAIIMHTLRLDYSEFGERRTFSVVIDETDIATLMRACKRALEKEQRLADVLEASNVKIIAPFGY